MSLSRDERSRARDEKREAARDYRRGVDERRPWLLPLLVGVAVVVVVGVIVYWTVLGG